jgi:hypothetical protein
MGRFLANLVAAFGVLLAAMLIAPTLAVVWAHAFIVGRTFTGELWPLAASSLLMWLYYLLFFFAFGALLFVLVRSPRPLAWGLAVGAAYCLWWLAAGSIYVPEPSVGTYVSIAGEYVSAVVGCVLGVAAARKVRRMAPNNSSKPTPLRGAA